MTRAHLKALRVRILHPLSSNTLQSVSSTPHVFWQEGAVEPIPTPVLECRILKGPATPNVQVCGPKHYAYNGTLGILQGFRVQSKRNPPQNNPTAPLFKPHSPGHRLAQKTSCSRAFGFKDLKSTALEP